MPLSSQPYTIAKLNDSIFGIFAHVPSRHLDHAVRYLSTWSGSDKLFMVIQYLAKLAAPFFTLRARIQFRAGLRKTPSSEAAELWERLGSLIGDSRVLWRIWGLLPIIQWLTSMERSPPPTRHLQTIERLQGLSMLVCYPLEHVYYLASQSLLPSRLSPSAPAKNNISIWSSRAWAVYVFLQFIHLKEDWRLLKLRERALKRSSGKGNGAGEPISLIEDDEITQRRRAIWNELFVNIGYLPLTLHWSFQRGVFRNEAWVGLFGTIAAIASLRGGWDATAPPPVRS